MKITVVCAYCRNHDKEPIMEINFRDGIIYYMCPECKKESQISLKVKNKPLPRTRSTR